MITRITKLSLCALLTISATLFGKNKSSVPILLSVPKNTHLSVSGNPGALRINSSNHSPVEVSDDSTTYSLHSNLKTTHSSLKISGAFASGEDLPKGVNLLIYLASDKGSSTGTQVLSAVPVDLVTNLSGKTKEKKLPITYTFRVDNPATTPSQMFTRAVVLTVTNES